MIFQGGGEGKGTQFLTGRAEPSRRYGVCRFETRGSVPDARPDDGSIVDEMKGKGREGIGRFHHFGVSKNIKKAKHNEKSAFRKQYGRRVSAATPKNKFRTSPTSGLEINRADIKLLSYPGNRTVVAGRRLRSDPEDDRKSSAPFAVRGSKKIRTTYGKNNYCHRRHMLVTFPSSHVWQKQRTKVRTIPRSANKPLKMPFISLLPGLVLLCVRGGQLEKADWRASQFASRGIPSTKTNRLAINAFTNLVSSSTTGRGRNAPVSRTEVAPAPEITSALSTPPTLPISWSFFLATLSA